MTAVTSLAHPLGRLGQLARQLPRRQRRGDPAQRRPRHRPGGSATCCTKAGRGRRWRRTRPASTAPRRPRPPARPATRPRRRPLELRRRACGSRTTASASRCRSTSSLGLLALHARLDEHADRRAEHLERVGEIGGGARAAAAGLLSSWARPAAIVPSDVEPLAVLLHLGDPPDHRPHPRHHLLQHRPLRDDQLDERHRARSTASAPGSAARSVSPPAASPVSVGDRADPGRAHVIGERLLVVPSPSRIGRPACPRAAGSTPASSSPSRAIVAPAGTSLASVGRLAQLVASSPLDRRAPSKQVDRASSLRRVGVPSSHRPASARYSWISETAIEPSPTALATRLIERARTSPATNTPGTLVSSASGSRASGQPCSRASGPARMKPRSSRATTPSSQSVRGVAPMNTKQASTSSCPRRRRSADPHLRQPTVLADRAATACVSVQHLDSAVAARSARSGSATSTWPANRPRTSIVTRAA